MGTSAITVERTSTDVDLTLTVSQNGGVTGLTAVVAIRDGDTANSYLDFADGLFKTVGWVTRQTAMTDIGGGHYRYELDITAINNLPAGTEELVAEYKTSGALASVTHDKLQLVASFLSLATAASVALNGDLIESQRGHRSFSGAVHYVDGFGGDDTNGDGSRSAPYKTISKAITQVTSNGHDLVYLLANAGGGPTVISESATIDIAKNYVFIRGPGRDVSVTNTGSGNVFDITGDGVELSGFRILAPGAAATGVKVSGADFVRLHWLWIVDPFQDCIEINVGTNCEIERCQLLGAGRDGVRVSIGAGMGYYTSICDTVIRDAVGSAVRFGGADASECRVQRNVIRDNAVGIRVIAGTVDTVITDNRFINNAGGDIVDGGTRTLAEWNSLPEEVWSFVIANAGAPISGLASGSAARFLAENNLGAVGQVRLDYTTDPVEEHYYDFDGALLLTRYLETNVAGEKATTQTGVQTKRLLVPTP